MTDENRDLMGAFWLILALTLVIALFAQCNTSHGAYVIEFTDPSYCVPCQMQAPVEKSCQEKGCDIRVVAPSDRTDLTLFYHITKIPTAVLVYEGADGKAYDSGKRLVGVTTPEALQRFCTPKAEYIYYRPPAAAISVFGMPVLWVW